MDAMMPPSLCPTMPIRDARIFGWIFRKRFAASASAA